MGQTSSHNEFPPLTQRTERTQRTKRTKTMSGIKRVIYYPGFGLNYPYIQQFEHNHKSFSPSNDSQLSHNSFENETQFTNKIITNQSNQITINTNTEQIQNNNFLPQKQSHRGEVKDHLDNPAKNNQLLKNNIHSINNECQEIFSCCNNNQKQNQINIKNQNINEQKIETKIEGDHINILSNQNKLDKENQIVWGVKYIQSFQKLVISNQTTLLNEEVIAHLEKMKIHWDEFANTNNSNENNYNRKNTHTKRNNFSKKELRLKHSHSHSVSKNEINFPNKLNNKKWDRKNYLKEIEEAHLFKKKLDEIKQQDPVKFDLTEYLNMLTIDNYNETKELIFNRIKEDVINQEKFLEVLFQKAVHEKSFVTIYAKLCKDLDKELPQKFEGGKTKSSAMRKKLIEKCREIFRIDNNEQIEGYIKVKDHDERQNKIKKFILGNVNFIGELISIKLLSKKIVFQCIELLFKRYDKNEVDEGGFKLISLEGIIILIDKFGTLIHKQRDSIVEKNYNEFIKNINDILTKLDTIQKNDNIPGYVKYKIINLIEKKKGGWEESKFEKNISAKSKEEVRKAFEESQNTGNNKESNTKKYDQEQIDDLIRKDLIEFKDFIEDGNDVNKYQWEIISDIYNNRQNSIAEILGSFIQNCIDFVQNNKTLKYSSLYWEEFIQYYGPNLNKNEKKEIINQSLLLLSTVSSISLDNPMILDIWAIILYLFNQNNIFNYSDFDNLEELTEDDLKNVFEIMNKIKHIDKNLVKVFEKLKIVINNKGIYDGVVKE